MLILLMIFFFSLMRLNKFRLFIELIFTLPWFIPIFLLFFPRVIRLVEISLFFFIILVPTCLTERCNFVGWIFDLNSCWLFAYLLINYALNSVSFFIFHNLSFDFRFNLISDSYRTNQLLTALKLIGIFLIFISSWDRSLFWVSFFLLVG